MLLSLKPCFILFTIHLQLVNTLCLYNILMEVNRINGKSLVEERNQPTDSLIICYDVVSIDAS